MVHKKAPDPLFLEELRWGGMAAFLPLSASLVVAPTTSFCCLLGGSGEVEMNQVRVNEFGCSLKKLSFHLAS